MYVCVCHKHTHIRIPNLLYLLHIYITPIDMYYKRKYTRRRPHIFVRFKISYTAFPLPFTYIYLFLLILHIYVVDAYEKTHSTHVRMLT